MKLRVLFAGLIIGCAALAAETGAELFQKAVTQERAAGNLEEAIKLYQRVAKEFASDRALAAKALVQAARCYEKLGQDKAVKIYEQVARDFGDQREFAATASARLAALRQGERAAEPATMTARKIEMPFAGPTDGQRAIYFDDAEGGLVISDIAGKNKRIFFKTKQNDLWGFFPSHDFSTALLFTGNMTKVLVRPIALALIKTDGTGYREIGQLASPPVLTTAIWSWDNRQVLVNDRQPDGSTRLLRISVADGQSREVLRRESAVIGSPQFSPDGRFIAYSEGVPGSSKVLVMPSQGGPPQPVYAEGTVVDWTRDGRYLAINSGLRDARALYLLPIQDGKAAGEPVFIRYGSIAAGWTTLSGALAFVSIPPRSAGAVSLGTLDADGHVSGWRPLRLGSNSLPDPVPQWSPDSSQITYVSSNFESGHLTSIVHVRNITTEEDREIYRSSAGGPVCVWAAQHPNLFCGEITGPTTEILSVALDSGHVERLASLPGIRAIYPPSHDDSALNMFVAGLGMGGPVANGLVRWEIGTHQETRLGPGIGLSPDERWTWSVTPGQASRRSLTIRALSSPSPEAKRVDALRIDWPPISFVHVAFTSDGNWLYYHNRDSAGKDALFRVATAGGEPERMGDLPAHVFTGSMQISPDGRGIIVVAPEADNPPEIWLLENFVPKQQAAR